MINAWLPFEKQDALWAILAHHGVDDPELAKHLAEFVNWTWLDRPDRPFAIVLLSGMGIYPTGATAGAKRSGSVRVQAHLPRNILRHQNACPPELA